MAFVCRSRPCFLVRGGSQADGVVSEISAQVGETVESKDLLMKLKA